MASFSFGAGNAGKLLRIPLYLLGRVATLVIPRTSDVWVFGSAVGVADGALAVHRHATDAGERAIWLTGSADEDADARSRGIPFVRRHSLRGFWLTARARVIVITHGFGDVNRYAATGGVVVQLWHGIPLKRIGLDATVTTASPVPFARGAVARVLAALYRRTQGRIRVLPAASEIVRGRLESAFGLDTLRVPVAGEPRTDTLSQGAADERRARARARIGALLGEDPGPAPVVLYAPTWRDGAPDP
ncbi:CDP-glycerol glycerophosphotransferase family protein, partial [Microbacterium lacticum]